MRRQLQKGTLCPPLSKKFYDIIIYLLFQLPKKKIGVEFKILDIGKTEI